MTSHTELVEHFAKVGEICADEGILVEAFDQLTDRLAIHGEWCPHDFRWLATCRLCGTVRAGGKPQPGGCFDLVAVRKAIYLVVRLPVAAFLQFNYWVLRRDGLRRGGES